MVYTPKHYHHPRATAIHLPQLNLLFWTLIAVLGVVYLLQINFMVSGGYKMRGLLQRIEEIKKNSKQLELGALELQSMQVIREKSTELGLVPINRANYISARPPVVAFK
jgi:hypothetical protein